MKKEEVRIDLMDFEKEKLESGEISKIQGGDPPGDKCQCKAQVNNDSEANGTDPFGG